MTSTPNLATHRLLLRGWRESDREPFAQLNADPVVMEHFPATLSRSESDAMVDRIQQKFEAQGFGLWALERCSSREFLGFVGLNRPHFKAHFTPAIEIGWRLAHPFWGQGYACEAAREILRFSFETLALDEVVSFTATCNRRSMALMQRLGMTHDPADDFNHPALTPGHRLERHVLYRLGRAQWMNPGNGRAEQIVGRD